MARNGKRLLQGEKILLSQGSQEWDQADVTQILLQILLMDMLMAGLWLSKNVIAMSLDIKLTERKKNKQSYLEWTQGPYFSFAEGHLFYDTPKAYREMGASS